MMVLTKLLHVLIFWVLLSYSEPNVAPTPPPNLMVVSCFVWPQERLRLCYFPETKCYILYQIDARGAVVAIEIEWCIFDGYLVGG